MICVPTEELAPSRIRPAPAPRSELKCCTDLGEQLGDGCGARFQILARMSECHLAAQNIEERRPENTRHVTDLWRHRRLRQPAFVRCPREAPVVVCDRKKETEAMNRQPVEIVRHQISQCQQ